jgi:hypothetical protein
LTHQYRIAWLLALTIRFVQRAAFAFCGQWRLLTVSRAKAEERMLDKLTRSLGGAPPELGAIQSSFSGRMNVLFCLAQNSNTVADRTRRYRSSTTLTLHTGTPSYCCGSWAERPGFLSALRSWCRSTKTRGVARIGRSALQHPTGARINQTE